LGITRITRGVPASDASVVVERPARIETSVLPGMTAAIPPQASAACCGLTASQTISAVAAASAGVSANRTPGRLAASASRAAGAGS
jgi:hypothetical protein